MRISLNTRTLRGHELPIAQLVDTAAKAGYQGIEPWPDDLKNTCRRAAAAPRSSWWREIGQCE